MTGVELLHEWYRRIWVDADMAAVAEFLDAEGLANGLMPDFAAQLADFQSLVPAVLHNVRNLTFKIEDSMEVGDRAWARVRIDAQKAEDMTPVHVTGQVMIRLRDGMIIEAHNHFDLMGYFEQMGNLPHDSVALCLAGEELS